MIVISGIIIVTNEIREECLACLRELKNVTMAQDEGVVAYRIGQDIEDPNQIHIYEEWESTEALKAHGQKPHMDAFRDLRKKHNLQTSGFSRWRAEELGQF
jgi:quinol monooxygenase YgiN